MLPQWTIEKKRDGQTLAPEEIRAFILAYAAGRIPDYQMAALAMAVFFQGLSAAETAALTQAMLESGESLDLASLDRPRIDKHSTGGVGDKVSLILAPLAAGFGVAVPMIAGRGLGLTGGTIDKLESIPGYRADLPLDAFREIVSACGCSIISQTPRLCPADRKLYALRDVTGTVPSIPLITASIMSKKLAESLNGLVLDVKCGAGAFMQTRERGEALAASLMAVGRTLGLPVSALLTRMEEPLGRAVGNRPEIAEVVRTLRGQGPGDLLSVTLALTARMLRLAGRVRTDAEAMPQLQAALQDGSAEARFREMVRRHGGDPAFLDDPDAMTARAGAVREVRAPVDGYVARVDAGAIGRASLLLGAGRAATDDSVDPDAGLASLPKIGEPVRRGQCLARLFAADTARIEAAHPLVESAFAFSPRPVQTEPVLIADLGVAAP